MQFHKYLIFIHALFAVSIITRTTTTAYHNDSSDRNGIDRITTEWRDPVQFAAPPIARSLAATIRTQLKSENAGDKILLSRKRRYLIFPEGSSFQLVWDGIVGVVDYTNYLILGITVALAWELPSNMPSEILEDLQTRLADGTLGLSHNDTAANVTYTDMKPNAIEPNYIKLSASKAGYQRPNYYSTFQIPMHRNYYYQYPKQQDSYYRAKPHAGSVPYGHQNGWRRQDIKHYSSKLNPFTKWTQNKRPTYGYTTANNNVQYPWWNLATKISNSLRNGKPSSRRHGSANGNQSARYAYRPAVATPHRASHQPTQSHYYQSKPAIPAKQMKQAKLASREHRVYPIFGKRSIRGTSPDRPDPAINTTEAHQRHRPRRHGIAHQDELSRLERIHIRHHRSSRHTLYDKIEKYLDKMGHDGHHCVLRALCETGQKAHEQVPGSFVGELMRAVFTMPEAPDDDSQAQHARYKEHRYDAATAYRTDCAARYRLCKHSMWQSEFVV